MSPLARSAVCTSPGTAASIQLPSAESAPASCSERLPAGKPFMAHVPSSARVVLPMPPPSPWLPTPAGLRYPLMPLQTRPFWIWFWNSRKITMVGREETMP